MNEKTEKELVICFEEESCTQCHGCEVACKSWRQLPPAISYRRLEQRWRGEYPQVSFRTFSIGCLHCIDPACMAACPVEAISKSNENGLVRVDEESCTGCQVCSDVCPFGVPQFDEASGIMGKCDLCLDQQLDDAALPCIATCPNQALSLKWVTVEEKRELEGTLQQALR